MPPSLTTITDEARLTARAFLEFGANIWQPTLRLGITGLSGAGKTVFITALVHALLHGGRFPVFEPLASGRIARARLEPQPDDAVPRFDYEPHLRSLVEWRVWPESTRQISELRLAIEYQSAHGSAKTRTLTLDLVDYPGEWLLDLPLLGKTYRQWSAETILRSRHGPRALLARPWHAHLATLDASAHQDEQVALTAARLFTDYLRNCRAERYAMSVLPPGRFLLPGDLAGSPALTFAPLEAPGETDPPRGSLWAMMERRYEAYKDVIVRPFFRDHFARLDRQIVLVDALAALNAGPDAVRDLEAALTDILACFRTGSRSLTSILFRPRIDRLVFAATKADHLHHTSHDRLERILARMTERAARRAAFSGAGIDVIAMAAVRATREAQVARGSERLPSIIGTPLAGEVAGGERFDGATEVAVFPGDLPEDPAIVFDEGAEFKGLIAATPEQADFRFLRFRPPQIVTNGNAALPHIRLDRALHFLIGDRLS